MNANLCRLCSAPLREPFCDLGTSPPSNLFLRAGDLARAEPFYPLRAFACGVCRLVQVEQFEAPAAIFSDDYAYFSSYSDSWLAHCSHYAEAVRARLDLGPRSLVVELASNDGYLLQYFRDAGIPVLGIEPAGNVAAAARAKGIPTLGEFFGEACGRRLAAEGRRADLLIGNNVLAHVPEPNDFVAGMRALLAPRGTITLEFPHLLRLVAGTQFDTIYHEHFSYFSLATAERLLASHGLAAYDVEELPTHGGSLRLYACHDGACAAQSSLARLRDDEARAGLADPETYAAFARRVREVRESLLGFLRDAKAAGKRVVGYGAPAKANTLLNYCGIRAADGLIDYVVDRNPHKQGRFLPGSRLPVHAPERIRETRPEYVLILPWNLREEIVAQLAWIRDWGGRFVLPVPAAIVLE
ncbi:MAG: methyltransferase domain-containing protein [Betaproteobacteria bacterium]